MNIKHFKYHINDFSSPDENSNPVQQNEVSSNFFFNFILIFTITFIMILIKIYLIYYIIFFIFLYIFNNVVRFITLLGY